MKKTLILLTMILFFAFFAKAEDADFRIYLTSDNIAPGRQTELVVELPGSKDIAPPEMPFMEGVMFRQDGLSVKDDVKVVTYKIRVSRAGSYSIGPLAVFYDGKVRRSNQVVLNVGKVDAPVPKEEKKTDKEEDIAERIFLEIDVPVRGIYVNEKVPVKLKIYSDWLDVENVKVLKAFNESIIATEFVRGKTEIVERDGTKYAVLVFKKTFFAPQAGQIEFEPIEVKFNVAKAKKTAGINDLLNDNKQFYDAYIGRKRYRSLELSTQPVSLTFLDLPVKGRPKGFLGAVGSFDARMDVDMSGMGDKQIIKVVTTVHGEGNFNTVSMPVMEEDDACRLYPSDTRKTDGGVRFEQKIKIIDMNAAEIPLLRFVFFDPKKGKYIVVQKGPFKVKEGPVFDQKKSEKEKAVEEDEQKGWVVALKGSPGRFYRSDYAFFSKGLFVMLQILPLLFLGIFIAEYRRRWILTSSSPKAAYIRAGRVVNNMMARAKSSMRKNDQKGFYEDIFQGVREYISERFNVSAGNMTEETVEGIFSEEYEKTVTETVKEIFVECYLSKYTDSRLDKSDMAEMLKKAKEVIEEMNGVSVK